MRVRGAVCVAWAGLACAIAPAGAAAAPIACTNTALVSAIEAANANLDATTIDLPSGCTYTFTASLQLRVDDLRLLVRPVGVAGDRVAYHDQRRRRGDRALGERAAVPAALRRRQSRRPGHAELRDTRRRSADAAGRDPQGRPGQGRRRGERLQRRWRRRRHGRRDLQPGKRHARARHAHRPTPPRAATAGRASSSLPTGAAVAAGSAPTRPAQPAAASPPAPGRPRRRRRQRPHSGGGGGGGGGFRAGENGFIAPFF